ncbi:hypothetical protein D3C71_1350770 [compost metagenome]
MQGTCAGAFGVAAIQLDLIQRVAAADDVAALDGHFLTGLDGFTVGSLIGLQRTAVVSQYAFELTQGVWLSVGEVAVQRLEAGNGRVQLYRGLLLSGRVAVGGVAPYFVTGEQELLLGLGDDLELFEALIAQWHLPHAGIDVVDQGVGAFGALSHGLTRRVGGAVGVAHLVQGLLVGVDDGALFPEQLEVFRALEARQQGLLLGLEAIEGGLHGLRHGLVAVGQHVLQTGNAQFGQARVELGDVAHPVAAVDQPAQAGPAGQGKDAGKGQHQAETQAQLQVDADIGKPAIHRKFLQERCAS